MVTTAPSRTPHAIQSGLLPGLLWVLHIALGIIGLALTLLILPEAGRHFAWKDGVLTPDTTFTVGIAIALAVMVVITLAQLAIRRFLDMRIPGRLLNDGLPAVMAPTLIATALGNTILGFAAFHAATHSSGDHGLTKMALVTIGVCVLAALPGGLLFIWGRGRPGRREEMIVVTTDLATGGAILLIASASSSGGIFHSVLEGLGIGNIVIATALISLIIGVISVAENRGCKAGKEAAKDPLRTLSDRIVDTRIASPTVRHYRRAYRLTLVVVGGGLVIITLSVLVLDLLGVIG